MTYTVLADGQWGRETRKDEDVPQEAPAPEVLADNGAKSLQEARRDVAEATPDQEERAKVQR